MSIGQYMDGVFFISLGITFILLFLMAFHFKSRIDNLEKKNSTLTQICTSLINEVRQAKTAFLEFPQNTNTNKLLRPKPKQNEPHIDDDDDDDEDDDEDDDDDDNDNDNDNEIIYESNIKNVLSSSPSMSELDILNLLTSNHQEFPLMQSHIIIVNDDNAGNFIDGNSIYEVNELYELNDNKTQNEETITNVIEIEDDDITNEYDENSQVTSSIRSQVKDYKKMTVQMLKTVVISKLLCTDPSKMKKPELLAMLSSEII
jgi:hypothetical protein